MRKELYTAFSVTLLLTALTTPAQAQDTSRTSQLNEVVVTASKFAQKSGETGKVITVLDHDYLEKNSGKSLTSILNTQAGMVVIGAENTPGTNQDVFMRGAATGNTLILIDGMPVNDASQITNTFDLNFINPEQIEKIEILRGAQSTLYGSDAVAGVVNIITRKAGARKTGAQASLSYGSYNTYQGSAGVNGTLNKFSYLLGYKYEKTDGFSSANDPTGNQGFDKDGFKKNSAFGKLGLQATDRLRFQYLLSWGDYNHDLDAGAFKDEKDYTSKSKYLLNAVSSEYTFKNGSWHVIYSYQRNRRTLTNDSLDVQPGLYSTLYSFYGYTSNTHQVETYVNWDVTPQLQLVAGADYRTSNTTQDGFYMIPGDHSKYSTALGKDSAKAHQFSHYASLILHNLQGFNLEVGGRFNYHNIYGNNQTISFSPSYLINNKHKLFINVASAYKVPSLYQLYSEFGNKDLKPESSVNYEAGYQSAIVQNKLNFRVVGFKRDTRDLINFYSDPVTYEGRYINTDKQNAYGAETEVTWNITDRLTLTANYTYTDGKVKEKDTSYNNLYRRPRNAVNAILGYQATKALYVSAQGRSVGRRWDSNNQLLEHYYTIDLYGEYKFGRIAKIFADFRNITDQEYFDITGYNTRKFNFTAGVSFNL